eukprot:ctg_2412.g452
MKRVRAWWGVGAAVLATVLIGRELVSFESDATLYSTPSEGGVTVDGPTGEPREAAGAADKTPAADWAVALLRWLPLRLLSQGVGYVSVVTLPAAARKPAYTTYCWLMPACALEEVRDPLDTFRCLAEFHARRLKPSARQIDRSGAVLAPCDGRVLSLGTVGAAATLYPIKGQRMSLRELLGVTGEQDRMLATPVDVHAIRTAAASSQGRRTSTTTTATTTTANGDAEAALPHRLYYAILHLPAGGYHRFHSPVDWRVRIRRHMVGELFPVAPRTLRRVPDLLSLNERVCLLGEWPHGFFAMVAVGSTGIGNISLEFDDTLHTNRPDDRRGVCARRERRHDLPVVLRRGQDVGAFHLGSCIVLVFEAPVGGNGDGEGGASGFRFVVQPGESVRMGEALGR